MKNCRSVSNLSFLSKLVERVVVSRLVEHMAEFDLHDTHQPAYRSHRSCETALIRAQGGLLRAMDNQKVDILLLLDLSAAIDTVSHDVVLGGLETDLGLRGTALNWFRSYLTDQRRQVSIGAWGVFRASCHQDGRASGLSAGPTTFLNIHQDVLVASSAVMGCMAYDFYADDSQMFIFVEPVQALVDGAMGQV